MTSELWLNDRNGEISKQINIPVGHMSSLDEFEELFILAFCKG